MAVEWHKGTHAWSAHDKFPRHAHSMNGLLTIDPHDSTPNFGFGAPGPEPVTDSVPQVTVRADDLDEALSLATTTRYFDDAAHEGGNYEQYERLQAALDAAARGWRYQS